MFNIFRATTPPLAAKQAPRLNKRRGVVIVAVLVVVTILAYVGYSYSDLMLAEYRASENAHRALQARGFADSGIHFAAAVLSNPQNMSNILNNNPWNNDGFKNVAIQTKDGVTGRFSLIAPADPDDTSADPKTPRYGVTDEGGKINVNAMMIVDPTGQALYNMLLTLPNMTEDIAASIVSWLGGSYGDQNNGATNDYYQGLIPSYQAKLGQIDSIDELLLVRGVTWQLLYGSDANRNGVQETNENGDGSSAFTGFDLGWSAYLTAFSREQNYDNNGNLYVNLNNADLQQLHDTLVQEAVSEDIAKFIVMYRQYGPSNPSGANGGGVIGAALSFAGIKLQTAPATTQGDLSSYTLQYTKSGKTQLKSIWQLVNTQVSIPGQGNQPAVVYASPLTDATLNDLMPSLFTVATLSQANELTPRINVNTASSTVLTALTATTPLTQNDVTNILSKRPPLTTTGSLDPSFQTPAWLYSQAGVSLATLQQLDQYITTRSQVYRVQSVGSFDNPQGGPPGPSVRLEAVIDTNSGRPRILAWRNLSELGKGLNNGNP